MIIKKMIRVLNIWWHGKLPYAKRYRKWMRGRLFRDLQVITPIFLKGIAEKYGDQNILAQMEQFGMMMPKEPEQGESALKVDITDVQETETGKVISWAVTPKHT